MGTARLVVFVVAASLCPAVAQANIWSWLEELSGPGPFHGEMLWVPVVCYDKPNWHPCLVRVTTREEDQDRRIKPAPIPMVVAVKIGWLRSDDGPRFKDLQATDPDNQGKVAVLPMTGLFLFRLHRSLDVGFGAGFMRVSGDGFDPLYRVSLVPVSASIIPLALNRDWQNHPWAYIIRAEIESSYLPQGFKGTDFNNSRTSFKSGPEFVTRAGFVLDVGAVARWIRHKG